MVICHVIGLSQHDKLLGRRDPIANAVQLLHWTVFPVEKSARLNLASAAINACTSDALIPPYPQCVTQERRRRRFDGQQRRYVIKDLVGFGGWWRGTVVERRSLAGELSLSCA